MLTSGPPWFVLRERSHLIKLATRLLFNHNKKTLMEVKASRPIGIQQLWPLQADAVNSNCVFHHVSYGTYMWHQGNIVLIICNKCKRIEESGRPSMCPNSLRVIGSQRFLAIRSNQGASETKCFQLLPTPTPRRYERDAHWPELASRLKEPLDMLGIVFNYFLAASRWDWYQHCKSQGCSRLARCGAEAGRQRSVQTASREEKSCLVYLNYWTWTYVAAFVVPASLDKSSLCRTVGPHVRDIVVEAASVRVGREQS